MNNSQRLELLESLVAGQAEAIKILMKAAGITGHHPDADVGVAAMEENERDAEEN